MQADLAQCPVSAPGQTRLDPSDPCQLPKLYLMLVVLVMNGGFIPISVAHPWLLLSEADTLSTALLAKH